jgi:hypothetical protein
MDSTLDRLLQEGSDTAVAQYLNEIDYSSKYKPYMPKLLEIMEKSEEPPVYKMIASFLVDSKSEALFKVIVKLLKSSKSKNYRTGLIYCCKKYDCTKEVSLFVDILINDRMMAADHAGYILLNNIEYTRLQDIEISKSANKLHAASQSREEDMTVKFGLFQEVFEILMREWRKRSQQT